MSASPPRVRDPPHLLHSQSLAHATVAERERPEAERWRGEQRVAGAAPPRAGATPRCLATAPPSTTGTAILAANNEDEPTTRRASSSSALRPNSGTTAPPRALGGNRAAPSTIAHSVRHARRLDDQVRVAAFQGRALEYFFSSTSKPPGLRQRRRALEYVGRHRRLPHGLGSYREAVLYRAPRARAAGLPKNAPERPRPAYVREIAPYVRASPTPRPPASGPARAESSITLANENRCHLAEGDRRAPVARGLSRVVHRRCGHDLKAAISRSSRRPENVVLATARTSAGARGARLSSPRPTPPSSLGTPSWSTRSWLRRWARAERGPPKDTGTTSRVAAATSPTRISSPLQPNNPPAPSCRGTPSARSSRACRPGVVFGRGLRDTADERRSPRRVSRDFPNLDVSRTLSRLRARRLRWASGSRTRVAERMNRLRQPST